MAFIETTPTAAAVGPTREMYARQQRSWGFVPNYAKVFSARPEVLAFTVSVAAAGGVPILVARRLDALESVKREIERLGGQAWVYTCDVSSPESVDVLVKSLLSDHEGIDMLVNNAGRSIRRSVKLSYDRSDSKRGAAP